MLKDACINMVISRLPSALLNTHVMTTVSAVIITTNMTMFATVGGVHTPVQNRGKCHKAHSTPKRMLPASGPYAACRRGSAKPRQPGSSPNGPPRTNVATKANG